MSSTVHDAQDKVNRAIAGRRLRWPAPTIDTRAAGTRSLRLGLKAPTNDPALKLGDFLTGHVPAHPKICDHFKRRTFGLYENDRYGDCGPTGVANHLRMVSGALLGAEVIPSQSDVFDLYRRSGAPNFNPLTGDGDTGVVLQTMLAALLKGGLGNGAGGVVKPVAFAKVRTDSDAELEAAASIFGMLWGCALDVAQQSQSTSPYPEWTYQPSQAWGGHCVMSGAYEPSGEGELVDVISWDMRIPTTRNFRDGQLQEAWVIVWPWLLTHPDFQSGVNTDGLSRAFRDITGRRMAT